MSTEELLTPRGTLPRQRSPLRRVLPRKSGEGHSRRFVAPGLDAAIWVILIDVVALTLAILLVSGGRIALTLLVTIVILLNASGGLYRSRVSPSLLDELPELVGRGLVAGAIATAVAIFVDVPVQQGPVHAAVIYLLIACTGRVIGYPILRRTRTVHGAGRPTIIVGEGLVGEQIATTLLSHREYGLLPVGFVDDNPLLSENDSHIPFLGTIRSLSGLLDKYQVRNIIVAFTSTRESRMVEILRRCDRARCEIYVVPRFYELDAGGRNTELIWGLPLTRLRRSAYRSPSWRVKRIFDIVAAGLGLIVLSPLLALCALAVRLEGGPGVIFRQERVGVDGRRFMILK
ncbi:MAG: sugar transferase, partial [Nocardioidaceae bacterium]